MKKTITILLGTTLILSLTACKNFSSMNETSTLSDEGKAAISNQVGLPNPFVDCVTLEDAEKIVGFEISTPHNLPEGYTQTSIQAIENGFVQITYTHGDDSITYRQGKGNADISGDYNEYTEKNIEERDHKQIILEGDMGNVKKATWQDGGFTFSITVNNENKGISQEEMNTMIDSIYPD
jgi:hypothetical protein